MISGLGILLFWAGCGAVAAVAWTVVRRARATEPEEELSAFHVERQPVGEISMARCRCPGVVDPPIRFSIAFDDGETVSFEMLLSDLSDAVRGLEAGGEVPN